MNNPVPCVECQAIRTELDEAYAEEWESSDENTRAAWDAVRKMIGGTEDDEERAEELLPKAQFRDRPRITQVVQKMFVHMARTGHAVRRSK